MNVASVHRTKPSNTGKMTISDTASRTQSTACQRKREKGRLRLNPEPHLTRLGLHCTIPASIAKGNKKVDEQPGVTLSAEEEITGLAWRSQARGANGKTPMELMAKRLDLERLLRAIKADTENALEVLRFFHSIKVGSTQNPVRSAGENLWGTLGTKQSRFRP